MNRTATFKTVRRLSGIALAICLCVDAQARSGQICLELPAGASSLKARIASGCLPTSPAYKGTFTTSVDAHQSVIRIDGGFVPVTQQRVATADCMGSRVIEQEVEAAGPRRYSVIVNGEYRGVIDASDTTFGMQPVSTCFDGPRKGQQVPPDGITTYLRSQFADWIPRPKDKATEPLYTAHYAMAGEVAAALLGDHPENFEGRPSAQVTITPARWRRMPGEKPTGSANYFMAIRIEEHGLADESISGKRTFASAERDPDNGGWRIVMHWHQWMCARGPNSGQWTSASCP